jgi:hypothetical protein
VEGCKSAKIDDIATKTVIPSVKNASYDPFLIDCLTSFVPCYHPRFGGRDLGAAPRCPVLGAPRAILPSESAGGGESV